jgi:hypothetical protein
MSDNGVTFDNINHSSIDADIIVGGDFYNISLPEPHALATDATSAFDCGHRVKWVREVLNLSTAEWVAFINYTSEKEWCLVEQRKREVTDEVLNRIASRTGMSETWLRTGKGRKMPLPFWSLHEIPAFLKELQDNQTKTLYMLTTSACRHLTFVTQSEPHHYRLYNFKFGLNFWTWGDDHGSIPLVLILLRALVREYPFACYTLYTHWWSYWRFQRGHRHPRQLLSQHHGFRYFLEDFVTGRGEPEYGSAFRKAQEFLAKEGVRLGHMEKIIFPAV